MEDYTISESCMLPSKGQIYDVPVNYEVRVRSMTTQDEMRRLSPSDKAYQTLCEIVDDCIVGERPGISSYDMCLGDYQVLLHKVRSATYGSDYPIESGCPFCGAFNKVNINLDEMEVNEYTDDV